MSSFRLFDLNDPQRQAVTTTEGPLLILAGAGTGKTRVITARVAYLLAQGTPAEQILAVTFTNKAANEMRERLQTLVERSKAKKVTMSTFHALCVRVLRSGIERLGYKNNFTIYDEGDQLGLIKKLITRLAARDEKLDGNLAKNLISKAKNSGWSAPEEENNLISSVFARYQQELKTLNAVDFDDLLLLTVKLLNEHEDVRLQWHRKYRYVMIDEFQDTNRLQLDLVNLLATTPGAAPATSRPNICVVGDDDQSIYGWRGAEVSNILEFEHHFPEPTIVKLEQNYRSTNAILRTANSLIKNNPRRRPKELWSAHGDGEKIRLIQMPDDRQEAEWIAGEIHKRNMTDALPWESFAILFRMNAQSRLLEENLRRLQIPYRLIGGKSFFDRREIRDLLAYANVIVNPDDDVNLLRIINTPARGISGPTTERATEFSAKNHCSVFAALKHPEFTSTLSTKTQTAINEFLELLDRYETRVLTPLTDLSAAMTELLQEVGYFADLQRSCKTPEEALSRETNVRDIINDLAKYQERSTDGLRGFLDEMALDRDREEEEQEDQKRGVTLITLHAAKGLEFPHVFLIGLEEGVLPHDRSKLEGTVDEERRLLYVGITRAMRNLTLTYCRSRIKFGSVSPCTPSSFIKELHPDYVDHIPLETLKNTPMDDRTVKAGFAAMRAALAKK